MNPLSRLLSALIVFLVLLAACGDSAPERADDLALTPQAGGLVLPTALPPATLAPTSQPASVALSGSDTLTVGQTVRAVGEQPLRLQADAHTGAPVLEVYPPGATFTVIEPSGDFTDYPVEVDNRSWYRLEAADGLVGWAVIDAIVAQPDQ
jgi:hypothetical protein